MTVYSIYIFDRHTECIYQKRFTEPLAAPKPDPQVNGGQVNSIAPVNGESKSSRRMKDSKETNDAKLVFGVVYSLRNMVRRLGGDDDEFISYRTGEYKLHYYETPTSMKFVMLTDIKTSSLRVVLHTIWANLYVEYVVRNPVSPVEHPKGVGVNNELFEMGLDRFITQVMQT